MLSKFHPSQVQSAQKSQFWAKCLTQLKISGFCPISSFRMSPVVKNVSFELNFLHESKCWLCKMSSFAGQEWSNSRFQAKFSTRLKISGFCQIHHWRVHSDQNLIFTPNFQNDSKFLDVVKFLPLQVQSGQKSHFWARFSTQIKIFLDFVKFHPLLVQSVQHSLF